MSTKPKLQKKRILLEIDVKDEEDFTEPAIKKKKSCSTKKIKDLVKTDNQEDENETKMVVKKSVKKTKSTLNGVCSTADVSELVSEACNIDIRTTKQIIGLLKNDNTIPFICRYRREIIGNCMTPENLREFRNSYESFLSLSTKIEKTLKTLEKRELLDEEVKNNFLKVKNLQEFDLVFAPFKEVGKKSLADRACALGLEPYAKNILYGEKEVYVNGLRNPKIEELDNIEKVEEGLRHIIASLFSKNTHVLEEIRKL